MPDDALDGWLAALENRHLANLTTAEVARALRALSSCYVERRSKIAEGAALDTRGKRAAFALFYGPLHLTVVRQIVRALPRAATPMSAIVDLGCGTGSAGAGWALESRTSRVSGIDRHPWAVLEATWTYRTLDLRGRARQGDFSRALLRAVGGSGIVAAYAINETAADRREHLQKSLVEAHREGASVLIVEPIARSIAPWWEQWRRAFAEEGGRSDEWRFPADLPSRQRALARAAGLDPQELTARSLWLCGRH